MKKIKPEDTSKPCLTINFMCIQSTLIIFFLCDLESNVEIKVCINQLSVLMLFKVGVT